MTNRHRRLATVAPSAVAVGFLALAGCTGRAISVTSAPPGAEVSINHRVVGRTPVRVLFTHYGTYHLELRLDRYQTLVRDEVLRPPGYGYDPVTFLTDNVIPARINDEFLFHYVLEPVREETDREALLGRAMAARNGWAVHPVTGEKYLIPMDPPGAPPGKALDLGPLPPPTPARSGRAAFASFPPALSW